jgi:hypothetical protein
MSVNRQFSRFGKLGKADGRPKADSRWTFDREPHGVCWVRVFTDANQIPVTVMGEPPQTIPMSVTPMAESLASERIQRHVPQRFAELPPAVFPEHYVEERAPEGRLGRKAT